MSETLSGTVTREKVGQLGSISYFSVAVIKHHDQSTIWKKGLFGLMVPKSKSPSWWKRLGSKWQAWGQEQKTADAHPQHKA